MSDRTIIDEPNVMGSEGTMVGCGCPAGNHFAGCKAESTRVLILCPKPIAQHFLVTLNKEQARRVGQQLLDWGNEP